MLSALRRRGVHRHEAVVWLLAEHDDLRCRVAELAAAREPTLEQMQMLGRRPQAHIRHEERAVFPLVVSTLSGAELDELGAALRAAQDG